MPNWAQIFKEVALRPGEIAKIAAENKISAAEILDAINTQSRTVNPNYDWARRAKEILAKPAQTPAEIAAQAEREAAKRAAQANAEREAERKLVAQRLAADKAKREAQRGVVKAGSRAVGPRASSFASQGVKAVKWGSRGLRVFLGVAGTAVGILLAVWTAVEIYQYIQSRRNTTDVCPPIITEYRQCPWTPDGYAVEACGPGFCWDGGPQGSLACKQEEAVANSHRGYTTDLLCDDGYVAERDPCTGVILRCAPQ